MSRSYAQADHCPHSTTMADRGCCRYPGDMPFRFRITLLALAFAASIPSCAYPSDAAEDPLRHAREVFLRAYDQAQISVSDAQVPDDEGLRTYPLYPYLQAARIRRALASA